MTKGVRITTIIALFTIGTALALFAIGLAWPTSPFGAAMTGDHPVRILLTMAVVLAIIWTSYRPHSPDDGSCLGDYMDKLSIHPTKPGATRTPGVLGFCSVRNAGRDNGVALWRVQALAFDNGKTIC